MKLTEVERLLLYNQYRILKNLYPDEAEEFERYREALQDGYENEYKNIGPYFSHGLSTDECEEVTNIMNMFTIIQNSYEILDDKSGIHKNKISFYGFSGNEEILQMAYARYLQKNGRFTNLKTDDNCNSHFPALSGQRNMLEEWNKSENKYHLTKNDILRIQSVFKMH